MRTRLLDETEHYPTPVLDREKFRGTGITLGCTHADCRWRLDRQLTLAEGEVGHSLFVELFALFHVEPIRNVGIIAHPDAASGLDLPQRIEDLVAEEVGTSGVSTAVRIDQVPLYAPPKTVQAALVELPPAQAAACPCPVGMRMDLRRIYYPECPDHGASVVW